MTPVETWSAFDMMWAAEYIKFENRFTALREKYSYKSKEDTLALFEVLNTALDKLQYETHP
jgi:hypothetical protein